MTTTEASSRPDAAVPPQAADQAAAVAAVIEASGHGLDSLHFVGTEVVGSGVLNRWLTLVRIAETENETGTGTGTGTGGESIEYTLYSRLASPGPPRSGVTRVTADGAGHDIDVWAYPFDPDLPALPAATVTDAAAILLDRLGLHGDATSVSVIAYRPGKRAVVKITSPQSELFVKIVPPPSAEPLHRRHRRWHDAGLPVPRSAGWSSAGLVALEPLGGVELASRVGELPAGEILALVETLRSRIGEVPTTEEARASLAHRVDWYRDAALLIDPSLAPRIAAVCEGIELALSQAGPATMTNIHGDLHLSQILVEQTGEPVLTGLLDIDTAGRGDPADDSAALIAHCVATAGAAAVRGDSAAHAAWTEVAEVAIAGARSGPADAALRTAAITAVHLIGHAFTGALPLARALELASRVLDEKALTPVS